MIKNVSKDCVACDFEGRRRRYPAILAARIKTVNPTTV